MEFTKQDQIQCDNLIKALKKGSFTLDGMEVLALAQAMSWLGKLSAVIAAQVEPPVQPQFKPTEVKDPITPAPVVSKPAKASKKGV